MNKNNKDGGPLTAIRLIILGLYALFGAALIPSHALAQITYPYQEVMIVGSTSNNLNVSGYANNSSINTFPTTGGSNERWRFSTTDGVNFKIINMTTNTLVSPYNWATTTGTSCVLFSDSSRDEQLWQFVGADTDVNGDYLNYKIVNKQNTSVVLTLNTSTSLVTIVTYSSLSNQKWKLNSSGLVGFAGFCKDLNGNDKTGTIGGLLGTTVFVTDLASFKAALLNTSPQTIVIAANIDNANSEVYDLRIASNKTIIGSYAANRLTDPRLRTDDTFNVFPASNNIIIKNLDIEVVNRSNVEAIAVYGSRNVWIDHCTFNSSLPVDVTEVGKFIWVNTRNNADPDYVTVAYNEFYHRYWTVAFGTASSLIRNNATVMLNSFDSCAHRTPQQGNGCIHVLNNYIVRTVAAVNNDGYSAIIGGPGAKVYSDANRFDNFILESSGFWDTEITIDSAASVKDVGSYTNKGQSAPAATPYLLPTPSGAVTTFSPVAKYSYRIIKSYDSSAGNDVKKFCTTYVGTVSSYSNLKYIHYPEFSSY